MPLNHNIPEAEAGDLCEFEASLGLQSEFQDRQGYVLAKKKKVCAHSCHPVVQLDPDDLPLQALSLPKQLLLSQNTI